MNGAHNLIAVEPWFQICRAKVPILGLVPNSEPWDRFQEPNFPNPVQVIYVWLDALANYLTVAGWEEEGEEGAAARFSNAWPPTVQVIGNQLRNCN